MHHFIWSPHYVHPDAQSAIGFEERYKQCIKRYREWGFIWEFIFFVVFWILSMGFRHYGGVFVSECLDGEMHERIRYLKLKTIFK
jgi:hypothetical protein